MTYDTIATISQITSLLMFVAMFGAVLAYALWPANGRRFEEAQRSALDLGKRGQTPGSGPDATGVPLSTGSRPVTTRGSTSQ